LQVLEFIEWAMKEIMKNPRVVKKAQAEIREALRGKKTITEAEIREVLRGKKTITEAEIREALRGKKTITEAEIREALRGKKTITEAEIREALLAFSRRKGKKIFQPRVFLFFFHQFTKTSPLILHTCMQFILNFDPSHFSTFLAGTWQ
jgi:hypothetical protein